MNKKLQILVTSTQFRMIYHRMAELIRETPATRDLAVALNLQDEFCEDNEAALRAVTSPSQEQALGALVGMDMHPRQNVYQASNLLCKKKKVTVQKDSKPCPKPFCSKMRRDLPAWEAPRERMLLAASLWGAWKSAKTAHGDG